MRDTPETLLMSARPAATYWAQYFLVGPMAGIMLGAFSGLILHAFFLEWPQQRLFTTMASLSPFYCALVVIWGVTRDRRKLRCDLFSDHLALGSGPGRTDVPFRDIESIVVGLPQSESRVVRIALSQPGGAAVNQLRANALVIRMKSRRAIALNLGLMRAQNSSAFLQRFVELNAEKFRKVAEYTEEERRAFSLIALNKLVTY